MDLSFALMEHMEYTTHSWKALLCSNGLLVTHSFVINRKNRWQTEPGNGTLMEPYFFPEFYTF